MSAEEPKLSASARKRANKKARDAAAAEEAGTAPAAAASTTPAVKATPVAAKAAEPKAKAKGKAKAEQPKAPEPAPVAPKAEAKKKGKAKAEPAKAEPPPEAPKAEAKAKAKGKAAAKGKAKPQLTEEEQEEKERQDRAKASAVFYTELDTGGGGDWEVSTGLSKKAQKQKEKQEEKKAMEKATKTGEIMQARGNQYIPGMAPAADQMASKAGAKAKAKASQSVSSVAVVTAAAKDEKKEVAKPVDNSVTATIKIDDLKMIGRLVGPKGANIALIKEKTGLTTFDIEGEMVTLHGAPDAVAQGEHAVRQLLEKGYMSLAYDDFEEEGVMVHPTIFPDLIGQKGAIIIEIKKQAKCEITIPAVPKNSTKKAKVTVAGTKESVRLGKEIISSIACYGHHPLIHPGVTHKEMEIEEWRYRYLIGSKGSEMRHIQNNYRVKVNIPREHSEIQNVLIVGEERDCDRAIKYIEKVMYEADQPRGRGAPEQSIDDGNDDGPVEDWMKPYLYQRK